MDGALRVAPVETYFCPSLAGFQGRPGVQNSLFMSSTVYSCRNSWGIIVALMRPHNVIP